jgi:5-methylcytosine-specific restriction endonuclease McrA
MSDSREIRKEKLALATFTRNREWDKLQRRFLKQHPLCAVCGTKHPEVHHIKPFHLFPSLELEESNLIALCFEHHLLFGHLMSYKSYNPNVLEDVQIYKEKIRARPKPRIKEGV